MSNNDTIKSRLKSILAEKGLAFALDELNAQLVESSERKNELIHLRARFNEHHREDIMGRITKADANVNIARFTDTFLYIVDRIEIEDLHGKHPQQPLAAKPITDTLDWQALEAAGLKRQAELLVRKINKLRERLLIIEGTDAAREFVLEEQIAQAETQLEELKGKL